MMIWISLVVVSWQGSGIEGYQGECLTLNFGVKTALGNLDVTEEYFLQHGRFLFVFINPIQGRSSACRCGPSIFSPGTVFSNSSKALAGLQVQSRRAKDMGRVPKRHLWVG